MNKLSRKDIAMLEVLAVTEESKGKLAEYIQQREKAAKAYKTFREAVVNGVEVEKVEKVVEAKRKFKTGDKVRVLCTGSLSAATLLKEGDIATVTGYKEIDNFMLAAMGGEPIRPVIVRSMESEGLLSTYPTGFFEESALELVEEKTPNELRAEVIQRAKDFVEKHRNITIVKLMVDINYIVNAEKRTVVVLLKCALDNKVEVKGIAKCNPDDVFNADIGKAIALGRALGKDVSEFENAVQPTEPVIGHKLNNVHRDDIDEITTIKKGCMFVNNTGGYWSEDTLGSGITKIIDDTDAIYKEETR